MENSFLVNRQTAFWQAAGQTGIGKPNALMQRKRFSSSDLDNGRMTFKTPELLLPAGSLDKMRAAYDFGADAVYAGQPRYSLRARNNEFRLEQIQTGIQQAHARGRKFFCHQQAAAAQRQGAPASSRRYRLHQRPTGLGRALPKCIG